MMCSQHIYPTCIPHIHNHTYITPHCTTNMPRVRTHHTCIPYTLYTPYICTLSHNHIHYATQYSNIPHIPTCTADYTIPCNTTTTYHIHVHAPTIRHIVLHDTPIYHTYTHTYQTTQYHIIAPQYETYGHIYTLYIPHHKISQYTPNLLHTCVHMYLLNMHISHMNIAHHTLHLYTYTI